MYTPEIGKYYLSVYIYALKTGDYDCIRSLSCAKVR